MGQGFFGDEDDHDSEEDAGDSSVSEERNPEDFINAELSAVKLEGDHDRPEETISVIASAFNNKKTFSCPKIKSDFLTGKSVADLSPEDVGWNHSGHGGFAGHRPWLVAANANRFGSQDLVGISHGMGSRDQLPDHQLNVAEGGATSASMPAQARELVRRLSTLKEVDVYNTWAMICSNCTAPDTAALKETIDILNRGIHKAFVILLGPIHVSSSYQQKANLLKQVLLLLLSQLKGVFRTRCACSRDQSNEFMLELSDRWSSSFQEVQEHADYYKVGRREELGNTSLFSLPADAHGGGHNYATKWLWNRLIAGPKYNLSKAVLSQDAYFCPSVGCPYFRVPENYAYCKILRHVDVKQMEREAEELAGKRTQYDIYLSAGVIVFICFVAVMVAGTFFYYRSKMGTRGRFEQPQMPDGLVFKHRATTIRKGGSLLSLASVKQEPPRSRLRPTAPSLDVSTPMIQELQEESSEE
ncbi:Phospholipase B1, membrane-associated [Aphelenchoides fujianensis]|nr:Phospholipase B1, membrane-associated [Aphelenchoides fujianensis]